jgi:hypothetical protein
MENTANDYGSATEAELRFGAYFVNGTLLEFPGGGTPYLFN